VLKHFTNEALFSQIDAAITVEDMIEQIDAVTEDV
jgi:heterodisulfide reductase subunit A